MKRNQAVACVGSFLSYEDWQSIAVLIRLSPRELEIAQLIFANFPQAQIAEHLRISRHTVHTHVDRIYRKLHISSQSELIVCIFKAFVSLTTVKEASSMNANGRTDSLIKPELRRKQHTLEHDASMHVLA